MKKIFAILTLTFFAINSEAKSAAPEFKIQIKDHKFIPNTITVPADQKIKLIVENLDSTIEEFESADLNREKLVGGGKSITIMVGPLEPKKYNFFGEFHQKTAQGTLIVK
jgi:plastocyanin